MSDTKARVTSLIDSLGRDLDLAVELRGLLEKQLNHLKLVNSDGLDQVNPEIVRITAEIGENAASRSEILKKLGLDPNEKGLSVLASKLPVPMKTKVEDLCAKLEREISACKSINRRSADQLVAGREILGKIIGNPSQNYPEQIV